MKANSEKTKQSKKATRRVLAGVLCGASVLSLVLSLVMPPISQAIANDAQADSTEETVMGGGSSSESTDVDNTNNGDTEKLNSDDAEGGASEDAAAAGLPSDDTKVEGDTQPSDAQPADDENNDENAPATVSADDYTKVNGDVAKAFTNGGKFQLTGSAYSNQQIKITKDTTIDLNGNMLCNSSGGSDSFSFFAVEKGATLTIEDLSKKTNDVSRSVDTAKTPAGQLASMEWEKGSGSNNDTPKSLTYYETRSTPNTDGLGTTETTCEHVVTGFGAIVAASGSGSVKQVISVADGCTLNLNGGMITTPRDLAGDGHIILAVGESNETQVNINGGFITGANLNQQRGGWGGGLCVVGTKVTVNMTGGVIAANKAASGGGIYAAGAKLNLSGGVISGNATYSDSDGLGGGILVSGGSVTVSGGYITNNKYAKYCGKDGLGDHGGAGLAANNGAHVTISDGQITGNYSEEAGGGVYVTNIFRQDMAWLKITGGIIASNVSFRSEGAGIRVGQKVDAMISGASKDSPVYITNNHCMSRFDWGGGGIFVQGCNETASNAGRLCVYSSYISNNTAGGYGGGVAVCPTGKTLVTNAEGTAIFGNTDAEVASSYNNENDKYNPSNNSGNNSSPHLSGGGNGKTEDVVAYNSVDRNGNHVFRNSGHADFFLAAEGHTTPVAVVSGKMLGDIDAKYSGSIELTNRIAIPANGAAQVKNSIGLTSGVDTKDKTTIDAVRNKATTFITGNYSWDHGGGIMSNGNLYLGVPADTYILPSLKLKATKALINQQANQQTNQNMNFEKGKFSFSVYRKDSDDAREPSWNDKTFNSGGCTLVGTAKNDGSGNITFDLGEQYIDKAVKANEITYYLVENAGNDPGITYDPDITYDQAVYKIVVKVKDNKTPLMDVPSREDPNSEVPLCVHNYTITSVSLGDSTNSLEKNEQGYYSIVGPDGGKTFTNKYTPYTSRGTWTPQVTKKVDGGEMKKFKFELYAENTNNTEKTFQPIYTYTSGPKNPQIVKFDSVQIGPLGADELDGNRQAKFTYYIRECDADENDGTKHEGYKNDTKSFKVVVTATDKGDGTLECTPTYYEVGASGKPSENPTTDPTFTNTYSTSLPLSGMSGVTLTYLAGAAVLCAAAAWMHIRRKANAKGGKRRE